MLISNYPFVNLLNENGFELDTNFGCYYKPIEKSSKYLFFNTYDNIGIINAYFLVDSIIVKKKLYESNDSFSFEFQKSDGIEEFSEFLEELLKYSDSVG